MSPAIDLAGYAFGWVFVALPFAFIAYPPDHADILVYFAVASFIDIHRYYTFSYVYLDREVRRTYPVRFMFLPALCLVIWTQTPEISRAVGTAGVPATGAVAAWIWLTVQLLWQDRGGAFQWRVAMPLFVGALMVSSVLAATVVDSSGAWIWLAVGLVVSVLLHFFSSRAWAASATSAPRTHWAFPVISLAIGGLTAVGSLGDARVPLRAPAALLMLTFSVWQAYHVIMQKYGILRVYSAKSGQPEKVPAWVDRMLVFAPIPAFVAWVGNSQVDYMIQALGSGDTGAASVVVPPLRAIGEHSAALMALGFAFWVVVVGIFLGHEWHLHRLRHAARLWYAVGTTLLYAAVFVLGLAKAYIIFASSHGIEYMVFIWAYQRRRYSDAKMWQATSAALRHPVAFYLGFTAIVVSLLFYANFSDRFPAFAALPHEVLGAQVREWMLWFTLYHGILHFYYDGFLWKLRRPELRAQL